MQCNSFKSPNIVKWCVNLDIWMAVIYRKRYLRKWCRYKDLSTEVSHGLIYIWNFPQPTPTRHKIPFWFFTELKIIFTNSLWTKYRVGILGFGLLSRSVRSHFTSHTGCLPYRVYCLTGRKNTIKFVLDMLFNNSQANMRSSKSNRL